MVPFVSRGAIACLSRAGRVLLIERGKDPRRGFWGFPGGAVEAGEDDLSAAARELFEETGLRAEPVRVLKELTAAHYLLSAVLMRDADGKGGGKPRALSDAAAVGWYSLDDIRAAIESGRPFLPDVLSLAEMTLASTDC